MFFLGCAMAIDGGKLPEACWALSNSVGWRNSHAVKAQRPCLIYYLLAKTGHQRIVRSTCDAKCSEYIVSSLCCQFLLHS